VVPVGRRGLRPGAVIEVQVEKGVYRGLGLARHEGQVVFVPHVVPGERARVRVEQAGRGYANARLLAVLSASDQRRTPPCPYVPRCGGCAHQEMDYTAQLALKEAVLRDALARAGVAWERPIPVEPSPETSWRTRASLHVAPSPQGVRLGFYEEGSHRLVDIETCLQLSESLNRTARAIAEWLRAHPQHAGSVRGLDLAESGDGRQTVACLHVEGDLGWAARLSSLAGDVPGLTGLGAAPVADGDTRFVLLAGDPHVESEVDGLVFRCHVRSFFQGNRHLVAPLARAVVAGLPPGGTVLDLYCGVGLFALLAARGVREVRGAEISRWAVDDARANAERAGLTNVRFETMEVAAALAAWPAASDERVILDPPRTGAGGPVVEALLARAPSHVVYVSCDPPTLGRDLRGLLAGGYAIESVRAFDLFPDTFHVETVVTLVR
jgi:23S rRNA (uracil1939-C5)-methyltransferase